MKLNILLFVFNFLIFGSAYAETLSNVALYNRCYAQMAGVRPDPSSSVYQQVANNQLSPLQACMNLLAKANLSANSGTTIGNTSDAESLNVLRNMHRLHASWFQMKDFAQVNPNEDGPYMGTQDLLDHSTPALYLTQGLFNPNYQFRNILAGSDILIPVRTNMNPANGAASGRPKTDYGITSAFNFAPKGDLIGLRSTPAQNINYTVGTTSGSAQLFASLGGGLLGHYTSIRLSSNEAPGFLANGGVSMPRKWGRAVYHDLLCRDLPVVRTSDGDPFVVASSTISYRTTAACVSCHASIDRTAGVLRNFRYRVFGNTTNGTRGAELIFFEPVSVAAETGWPATTDSNYYRRPPNGVLYFRNYRGELISRNVTNLADLATKITEQDDFYVCAAKRYYAYFTGVDADVNDIGDPRHGGLSAGDRFHRDTVIDLGIKLKEHNSLRTLIQDILNLPHYRLSDYGLNQ